MALATCLKCGKEVSGEASVCLECGARVSRLSKTNLVKLIGILLGCGLAVLILATFIQTREPVVSNVSNSPVVPVADFQEAKAKADGGDARAQNRLGEMYSKGTGVPQDYKEAAKWYRTAADQGCASAQKNLGELYEAGQGVPRDEKEAVKWYRKAANQGDVRAQYSLAVMYEFGRGLAKEQAEAAKWFRLAAEQGEPLAQYDLGQRYERGLGIPADPAEAYKWHSLAATHGIPDAATALDTLKAKMTRDQINEGKRRVAAFVPTKSLGATQ